MHAREVAGLAGRVVMQATKAKRKDSKEGALVENKRRMASRDERAGRSEHAQHVRALARCEPLSSLDAQLHRSVDNSASQMPLRETSNEEGVRLHCLV